MTEDKISKNDKKRISKIARNALARSEVAGYTYPQSPKPKKNV